MKIVSEILLLLSTLIFMFVYNSRNGFLLRAECLIQDSFERKSRRYDLHIILNKISIGKSFLRDVSKSVSPLKEILRCNFLSLLLFTQNLAKYKNGTKGKIKFSSFTRKGISCLHSEICTKVLQKVTILTGNRIHLVINIKQIYSHFLEGSERLFQNFYKIFLISDVTVFFSCLKLPDNAPTFEIANANAIGKS